MMYALDTNIISYFIQGDNQVRMRLYQVLHNGDMVIIPPIVYYEVLRGFRHKSAPKKEWAFSQMCAMYPVGEMKLTMWQCAAGLYGARRKAGKSVDDTDILIAAYCIVNGYTFVTNNTKHFEGIEDLPLVDWTQV